MSPVGSEYESLDVVKAESVLKVYIDRKDQRLNTIDGVLHAELADFFARAREGIDGVRAILLTGSEKGFCAGGDFDWVSSLAESGELDRLRQAGKRLIWDLLDVEVPIVAAVNRHAVGLGASMALMCDVIFMGEDAVISDPHVKLGLVAGDGGAAIWPLLLGPARAKELLLTGDSVDAGRAEKWGLVNRVVRSEVLEEVSMGMAKRLSEGAPRALGGTKFAVNKLLKGVLNTAFDTSTALEIATFATGDHRRAMDAMRRGVEPEFRGD